MALPGLGLMSQLFWGFVFHTSPKQPYLLDIWKISPIVVGWCSPNISRDKPIPKKDPNDPPTSIPSPSMPGLCATGRCHHLSGAHHGAGDLQRPRAAAGAGPRRAGPGTHGHGSDHGEYGGGTRGNWEKHRVKMGICWKQKGEPGKKKQDNVKLLLICLNKNI